ncbi:hypothetical protein [Blastococcus sp. VKM Ac-2987]|uniref:hypothetical protein n=1 Tax=Blastococcus sp. VKM Ac-2987 TaxID=3004141 RepID=UPI0022ABABEE|nr:hypothetical protein [Blastococcus sp. VKM Ac-2987]MCZ2857266.1 hypothetical protein [Blastococcus sp. VKM Ac-2987]
MITDVLLDQSALVPVVLGVIALGSVVVVARPCAAGGTDAGSCGRWRRWRRSRSWP